MVSRQPLKLFQENERKNSVRTKPEVVRSEALPQRKKTFLSDHVKEHILEREWETRDQAWVQLGHSLSWGPLDNQPL